LHKKAKASSTQDSPNNGKEDSPDRKKASVSHRDKKKRAYHYYKEQGEQFAHEGTRELYGAGKRAGIASGGKHHENIDWALRKKRVLLHHAEEGRKAFLPGKNEGEKRKFQQKKKKQRDQNPVCQCGRKKGSRMKNRVLLDAHVGSTLVEGGETLGSTVQGE